MSKFRLRQKFIIRFERALRDAGMQAHTGTEEKPKYWKGQANNTNADLFLIYAVTDNLPLQNADNKSIRRQLYINGTVFTRNGLNDIDFQNLCNNIEVACEKLGLFCNFSDDGKDNTIDTESPIDYINFEVQARMLNN